MIYLHNLSILKGTYVNPQLFINDCKMSVRISRNNLNPKPLLKRDSFYNKKQTLLTDNHSFWQMVIYLLRILPMKSSIW